MFISHLADNVYFFLLSRARREYTVNTRNLKLSIRRLLSWHCWMLNIHIRNPFVAPSNWLWTDNRTMASGFRSPLKAFSTRTVSVSCVILCGKVRKVKCYNMLNYTIPKAWFHILITNFPSPSGLLVATLLFGETNPSETSSTGCRRIIRCYRILT